MDRSSGRFTAPPGAAYARMGLSDEQGRPIPTIDLKSPDAWEVADLYSIVGDLQSVVERCDAYLAKSGEAGVVTDALFESVIVTYGRSFTSGASARGKGGRRRIDEVLSHLTPEQREVHEGTKNLRNTHVAHRVSRDKEHIQPVAIFDPATAAYTGIAVLSASLRGGVPQVRAIRDVAASLRELLAPVLDEETEKLRKSCEGAFPDGFPTGRSAPR